MSINVLHIRDTGGMLGAENVILELCRVSLSQGVNPIIGTFTIVGGKSTVLEQQAKSYGIKTVAIPCQGKFDLGTVRFLKNYIKENEIQLVHSHGYKEDIYAWLSKSTPLVASNHLWKRTTRALRLYAYIDSKILRQFDKIVAVSAPIRKDMLNAGIASDKITVIPNGISIDKFAQTPVVTPARALKKELGIPTEHTVIGMVSSLTSEKGHAKALPSLAKIINQHPSTHILIVGAGPELAQLQQLAETLDIRHNVTFTGSRNDVPALLSAIDIFLLYSTIEGLPMALLEAMASGKAIIATDVGDVGCAIVAQETGILLASQYDEQLFRAVEHLYTDKTARARLGRAAKKRVGEHFSSDAMAQRYVQLYRELVK